MQSFDCLYVDFLLSKCKHIFKRFLINLEISTLNVNEENPNFYVAYAKKKLFTVVFFILKRVL